MAQRKSIDCRDYPSEKNCSLKISGTEEEVLDAAVQHAISTHGHEETPELREQIKSMLKNESDWRATAATKFCLAGSTFHSAHLHLRFGFQFAKQLL